MLGGASGETEKNLSDRGVSHTRRARDQVLRRILSAWWMSTPATIAFVVAMAGMMLPAYAGASVSSVGGRDVRTLDLEPRLTLDVEHARSQVRSGGDKVERVVVVLVERER